MTATNNMAEEIARVDEIASLIVRRQSTPAIISLTSSDHHMEKEIAPSVAPGWRRLDDPATPIACRRSTRRRSTPTAIHLTSSDKDDTQIRKKQKAKKKNLVTTTAARKKGSNTAPFADDCGFLSPEDENDAKAYDPDDESASGTESSFSWTDSDDESASGTESSFSWTDDEFGDSDDDPEESTHRNETCARDEAWEPVASGSSIVSVESLVASDLVMFPKISDKSIHTHYSKFSKVALEEMKKTPGFIKDPTAPRVLQHKTERKNLPRGNKSCLYAKLDENGTYKKTGSSGNCYERVNNPRSEYYGTKDQFVITSRLDLMPLSLDNRTAELYFEMLQAMADDMNVPYQFREFCNIIKDHHGF